jgi:hypothetical protein
VTLPYPSAAFAALVAVVINGTFVPSGIPATLRAGKVVGPPALVARFADRVELVAGGTLIASRGERTCTARIVDADTELVELTPLARCLGARHIGWDTRTKTLALTFGAPTKLRSMPPFDASAPQVSPTTVFTPEPSQAPRVIETGVPHPRRTGIPVLPTSPSP